MPISATEKRIPGGFTIENATVLGHAALNGDFCLISYLPGVIRFGDPVERIINRYVLFIDGSKYPDNTVFTYNWTIDYLTETGAVLSTYTEDDPDKLQGIYDFNSRKISPDINQLPAFKKLRVKCRVTAAGTPTDVTLEHTIEPPFDDLSENYESNIDGGHPIAIGGNPYATQVSANFFRDFFNYNPQWDNESINVPMNIPLTIFYNRVSRSARKKDVYHRINETYYESLNENLLQLFKQKRKNLVGACYVKPHFLSMTLEETPFKRIDGDTEEAELFEDYNALALAEKTDLFNYARFPKANFVVCALMLQDLLNKAQEEFNCENYKGSDEDREEWKDAVLEDLKNFPDLLKNWLDEYVDGPQTDIGALDYRKVTGEVHKKAWSSYINQILSFSYADKTNAPRITDAYFARKVVTELGDALSVRFDRINDSKLLYQEYIVIETANLRGKEIECAVRTADTILTGSLKKTLKLISEDTPVKVFTGKVGDTAAFDAEHGKDEYANLAEFADKAIIKIGLRPDNEATYDSWVQNIENSAEKKARLELRIQPKDRGIFAFYGPEKEEEQPVNTGYSFLLEDDKKFTVAYFDKANRPRVKSALFMKKVAVPGGANGTWSVSFDRINDRAFGRKTFVRIETQDLAANQEMDCIVLAHDDVLTGKKKEALQLTSTAGSRKRFRLRKGNTDALRNNAGATPFTNLATFAQNALLKVNLRPSARAVFDLWAQNMHNAGDVAPLELVVHVVQPPTNDLYVFYGEEKFEEIASNSGGVFLKLQADRFTVRNLKFYEVYHRQNLFSELPANIYIDKIENDLAPMEANYYYNDINDNEHDIATGSLSRVRRRQNGVKLFNASNVANVPAGWEDSQPAPVGGDAFTNYYYANDNQVKPEFHLYDDIITIDDINAANKDYGIIRYRATANVNDLVTLIRMPDALNFNNAGPPALLIAYTFHDTQRRFCNPECYAAFIGVLAELSLAGVQSTGMCFGDATSYPSLEHPNGDSIDQRYFNQNAFDQRDQNMINTYSSWGFTNIIRGTQQNWLAGANGSNAAHNDHLHAGNFNPANVVLLNP